MKRIIWAAFIFSLCFGVTSCGKLTGIYSSRANGRAGIKKIAQFEGAQGTLNWAYYDATKRSSLIYVSKDGTVKVLAENNPDVALNSIHEMNSTVKIKKEVEVTAFFKTQKSIVELGKRTVSINLLRDALYRFNETYYSTNENDIAFLKSFIGSQKETSYFNWLGKSKEKTKSKDSVLFHLTQTQVDTLLSRKAIRNITSAQLVAMYDTILKSAVEISKEEINANTAIATSKVAELQAQKELENAKSIHLILANDTLSKKDKENFIQLISK